MGLFKKRGGKCYPITATRVVPDGLGWKWYLEIQTPLTKGEWRRAAESFIPGLWDDLKTPFMPDMWYNYGVNRKDQLLYILKKYMLDSVHFRLESIPDKAGGYKDIEVCDDSYPEVQMLRNELMDYLYPDGKFSPHNAAFLENCKYNFEISKKYGWIQAVTHDTELRRLYYRLYFD